MDQELILELPNDIRSIEHAVEYVTRHCSSCCDYARRLNLNFRVGLTEALSNAMLYGNDSDPEKRVRVEVTIKHEEVSVIVTDQGMGFDPASVPDPTLPGNISKTGGRGIFLMKALMDEVKFNERGNSVTLVLRFEGEASA
ncbi:MAG: ATP-binding protein [Gemmatimonadetes bacterium]|nr:ATP-binding protein [Gemmatimonadota bacterium]